MENISNQSQAEQNPGFSALDSLESAISPIVSVVVPVFNTESYLDESLTSVRSQTLGSLQIICVDDASTDESLAVLMKHAHEDERITVLASETNIGPGAARNLALQKATGRYVYFFDSDDILEQRALEDLVALAEVDTLDAVFFNARPMIDVTMAPDLLSRYQRQYRRSQSYASGISGSELVIQMTEHGEWRPSPCLYLTRHSFLKEFELRFTEGELHEDNGFTMRMMLAARRVGYDSSEFFIRRVRVGSITTTPISGLHVRSLLIAVTELILAPYAAGVTDRNSPESSVAVATQAELLFEDAIRKYLLLNAEELEEFARWSPARPEHAFVLNQMMRRVELQAKALTLEGYAEQADILRQENEAFRRSRALRFARAIRRIFPSRTKSSPSLEANVA